MPRIFEIRFLWENLAFVYKLILTKTLNSTISQDIAQTSQRRLVLTKMIRVGRSDNGGPYFEKYGKIPNMVKVEVFFICFGMDFFSFKIKLMDCSF